MYRAGSIEYLDEKVFKPCAWFEILDENIKENARKHNTCVLAQSGKTDKKLSKSKNFSYSYKRLFTCKKLTRTIEANILTREKDVFQSFRENC